METGSRMCYEHSKMEMGLKSLLRTQRNYNRFIQCIRDNVKWQLYQIYHENSKMTSLFFSRWGSKTSLMLLGSSEFRSKLLSQNMLQFFINGVLGADAYQRGSTNTRVVCALLDGKVPPCELTQHGSLNILKGNYSPVTSQAGTQGSNVAALPLFDC